MNSKLMPRIRHLFLAACLIVCASPLQAEIVGVVSSKSPLNAPERNQIEKNFLGRNHRFPEGDEAIPIDLGVESPEREEFYLKLSDKTQAQMKAYWSKIVFTGRGRPPPIVSDSKELIEELDSSINNIGYMDSSKLDDRVKVLFTFTMVGQ